MRTVAVVTGTRAEYGLLRPVMVRIADCPGLRLQLVVSGMHLAEEFGMTVREIAADGFPIDARVPVLPPGDAAADMAEAVGQGIIGFNREFARLAPDVVLVLGDRIEAFAATVAGALSGRVVGHIHGGDRSRGGFDESMRHAVTKLAHLHFAATKTSKERILKLGERPRYVWLTGAPGIDAILACKRLGRAELSETLGVDFGRPVILCVQHPVSTDEGAAAGQMRTTLEALERVGEQTILLYPNSDAGGRRMMGVIREYEGRPWLRTFPSLAHNVYLSLLTECSVMVGNSSSGIIEAPFFKVPVVNVGTRQEGRERSENVLDAAHDAVAIEKAVRRAISDEEFRRRLAQCTSPYGDGRAGERIAQVLQSVVIDATLLGKQITY